MKPSTPTPRPQAKRVRKARRGNNAQWSDLIKDVEGYLRTAKPVRLWENERPGIQIWEYDPRAHNIMLHIDDRDKILKIFAHIHAMCLPLKRAGARV